MIIILIFMKDSYIYCARKGFNDDLIQWSNGFYFRKEDMRSPERLSACSRSLSQLVPIDKHMVNSDTVPTDPH